MRKGFWGALVHAFISDRYVTAEQQLSELRKDVKFASTFLNHATPHVGQLGLVALAKSAAALIEELKSEIPERSRIVMQRRELALLNALRSDDEQRMCRLRARVGTACLQLEGLIARGDVPATADELTRVFKTLRGMT